MLYDSYITAYKMYLLRKADHIAEQEDIPCKVIETLVTECLHGNYSDRRCVLTLTKYTENQDALDDLLQIMSAFYLISPYKTVHACYTGYTDLNFWATTFDRFAVNITIVSGDKCIHRLITVDADTCIGAMRVRVCRCSPENLQEFSEEYSVLVDRETMQAVNHNVYSDDAFIAQIDTSGAPTVDAGLLLSDLSLVQASVTSGYTTKSVRDTSGAC